MQVHKAICAPSLGGIRVSRCLVCKQHTQRRPGRAAVLVIFRAKLPQSTSSWTPFGWELDKKFDSKYATVGEHTVHYLKAGQGKTVILMIASQVVLARSYRSTVNAMSREHTVVCLELPGCGRSNSVKQPFTHLQYADWIVQFLIYMDISKAVVIGHSCSTAPAIALAESHSSFVSHLILVSAIGGHAPRGLEKIVFGRLRGALLEVQFSIPGAFHGLYNVLFQSRSFWFWIMMTTSLDMTAEAANVQVPTLLGWGRHDYTCPLSAGLKYADLMPVSQLYVCEHGSHNWLVQRPEEFLDVVTSFVCNQDSTVKDQL